MSEELPIKEEKAIEIVQDLINQTKENVKNNIENLSENRITNRILGYRALETLLDLYQKEKEKNKELNRLKGFEMLDIFNMGKESSRQRIKHDWVEKEKIRKKLKEEQERLKAGFGKMYEESLGNSATRILQELLEERN